jgi:hypothetical protein
MVRVNLAAWWRIRGYTPHRHVAADVIGERQSVATHALPSPAEGVVGIGRGQTVAPVVGTAR